MSIENAIPARSRSSALSKLARTRIVRVSALIRLSSGGDLAGEREPRLRQRPRRDRRADLELPDEALRHAEVDEDRRAVVEGGDRRRGRDLVAELDAEDADPAVEGRPHHPVLERELGVAERELGLARRELGGAQRHLGDRVRAPELLGARQRRLRVLEHQPRPVERDRLDLGVEPDERRARPHEVARGDLDRRHPPVDPRRHRHRLRGQPVADRRDPVVDRRLDDRGRAHHRRRARPAEPGPPPAARSASIAAVAMPARCRIPEACGK